MSTFESAFARHTSSISSGEPPVPLPRRSVFFVLDADVCLPGVFDADMTIELRSLSVAQELHAGRADGMWEMSLAMARESIHTIDGVVLDPARKEWFWEAAGPGGRTVIAAQYTLTVGDREAAQGKAMSSLKIGG